MTRGAGAIVLAICACAPQAYAQTAEGRPLRRPELVIGGGLLGGASIGSRDANLRANDPAPRPFRLFSADSSLDAAPMIHVRAGLGLTRRLAVEGGLTWSAPAIGTSVQADVEGATPLRLSESVSQYFIDGTLVILLDEFRLGDRTVPYLVAGGGYLRQLHEGRTLVEQGQVYHAGGGAKYWLRTRNAGRIRATGLRGDVRVYFMRGGISGGDGPRPHVAVSGGIFLNF